MVSDNTGCLYNVILSCRVGQVCDGSGRECDAIGQGLPNQPSIITRIQRYNQLIIVQEGVGHTVPRIQKLGKKYVLLYPPFSIDRIIFNSSIRGGRSSMVVSHTRSRSTSK